MDETQISITVKPIYLERLVYWIIIITLAVLLAIAWLKDDTESTTKTGTEGQVAAQPTAPTPAPAPTPVETPKETCVDGKLNQDETDIDCGGTKCDECGNGDICKVNADCTSGNCTASKCAPKAVAPTVTLSGKMELDITNVLYKKAPNDNVKVTDIAYKVTNGLDEEIDGMIMKVYVKNKDGTRCLNQQTLGTCDEPYVEFSVSKLASGKSSTGTYTISDYPYMGPYLVKDTGYDPTDAAKNDFQVVAYLYDDAGNLIDNKEVKDAYLVSL